MKLTNAQAIEALLYLVTAAPQSYRRLIVCCPFVSGALFDIKVASHRDRQVPVIVITRPGTAGMLLERRGALNASVFVTAVPNLHAKVYMACGKEIKDSVAVIGSFNLTHAALATNVEIGVRMTGISEEGRRIITELEGKLLRLVRRATKGARL